MQNSPLSTTLVKFVNKESLLSNPLLIRLMLNPHHFYIEFRVIYEDQYTRLVDRFMILVGTSYR